MKREFIVGGISFNMIKVEGGTFWMGAQDNDPEGRNYNEKADRFYTSPVHKVTLSDYYIAESMVTQELWETVMGKNPSFYKGPKKPVNEVSWNDAQDFIEKLNEITGENFRLPTEAEWEFAAKGGTKSKGYIYAGSNDYNEVAWNKDNCQEPQDVMTKLPNELGIYDMCGNLKEMCQDYYAEYPAEPQINPQGPKKEDVNYEFNMTYFFRYYLHVLRSNSVLFSHLTSFIEDRSKIADYHASIDVGFRLAL